VHHGFYQAYLDVREQVADRVSSLMIGAARNPNDAQPTLPIYVTGHSLGAALALLCALDLDNRGFVIGGVYTFGGPRVGDVAWLDLYDASLKEKTFRFVNELDIVPRVPGLLMGYRHVGHEVFFPCPGRSEFDPSMAVRLVSDAVGAVRDYLAKRVSCFTDHPATHYVEQVEGMKTA
jgi:triacylglycerol lipase